MSNTTEDDDDAVGTGLSSSSSSSTRKPLQGVLACLTGMSPSRKDCYHDWIHDLGGKFTRDFHSARNTHLIAETATGAKYETAVLVSTVKVVKPQWLEDCHAQHCHVREQDYHYQYHHHDNQKDTKDKDKVDDTSVPISVSASGTMNTTSTAGRSTKFMKRKRDHDDGAILSALEQLLLQAQVDASTTTSTVIRDDPSFPHSLFSCCQFYLMGFLEDDDNDNNNTTAETERQGICRLIRRGMGTIAWEFHSDITHVVIRDHPWCDTLRDAIRNAPFDNHVAVVSPWWIVESYQHHRLQPPRNHPPQLEPRRQSQRQQEQEQEQEQEQARITKPLAAAATTTRIVVDNNNNKPSTSKKLMFLRGSVFVLLHVSNPSPWLVDYNVKELEITIQNNGGQLVSSKLLETLLTEQQQAQEQGRRRTRNTNTTTKRSEHQRTCYVVSWGASATLQNQQVTLHPLLSQIQRKQLCRLVMVTPNWLQTCCAEQQLIPPQHLPMLFQPQSWPWRKFHNDHHLATTTTTNSKENDRMDHTNNATSTSNSTASHAASANNTALAA
jgi:twin BRCT domain